MRDVDIPFAAVVVCAHLNLNVKTVAVWNVLNLVTA